MLIILFLLLLLFPLLFFASRQMFSGDQVLFYLKYCLTASGLTEISLQNVHKLTMTRAEAWSTVLSHVRMCLKLNLEANISEQSTLPMLHFFK